MTSKSLQADLLAVLGIASVLIIGMGAAEYLVAGCLLAAVIGCLIPMKHKRKAGA